MFNSCFHIENKLESVSIGPIIKRHAGTKRAFKTLVHLLKVALQREKQRLKQKPLFITKSTKHYSDLMQSNSSSAFIFSEMLLKYLKYRLSRFSEYYQLQLQFLHLHLHANTILFKRNSTREHTGRCNDASDPCRTDCLFMTSCSSILVQIWMLGRPHIWMVFKPTQYDCNIRP